MCADPDTVDIVNQIPDKRLPKEVLRMVWVWFLQSLSIGFESFLW